jgi:adenylate cyclase class 2
MIETEVKIRFAPGAAAARELIERHGYVLIEPRTLESDRIFDRSPDRSPSELKSADQLLRLRRAGSLATVTYKGPADRQRYKSREEIEFDVSDPDAFELVLARLGYTPHFRYEKFRTKFAAPPESGIITIDETPIGVFLELEGEASWIDRTAGRLGFSAAEYCTVSYASLYREYLLLHEGAPPDMVFHSSALPEALGKDT